ncbi:hypothetical protein CYMTET_53417 [Cymbomonas tetramitiformis]|uniref:Uncharacterized protein n=1 Tax=Cymbomonas tetramitiformis TaxID=36881 RepID=A0AAE0BIS4_9CHLO|nr:hypothetical protein CYMTET_53417 [Cymbomonas tetramitiformis]
MNCHMIPNRGVRFNDVDLGALGFPVKNKNAEPEAEASTRAPWMSDFDFMDERLSRASLMQGFPVVQQMFKRDGKTVNPHQKPQALLKELINVHMMGDDPTNTDENGHPFNWILNACCGVASTSIAALRTGMNVIAFDNDPAMASSSSMRLQNFEDEPDPAEETRAKKASDDKEADDEDTEGELPADLQDKTVEQE